MICTLSVLHGGAQIITGKILDNFGDPVPFAVAALMQEPGDSIVVGTYANETGQFTFSFPPPGSYKVKISSPGFNDTITAGFKVLDSILISFPDITLMQGSNQLKEVSVTTSRKAVEFKSGNITVNVEGSPLAMGNRAYDLLFRLPGVAVDQDRISIQGREGVKVLINGRLQQLSDKQVISLLKSMSASMIEKIEVLKNPPIRYEAEGTAGLINIITKKAKMSGLSGNAALSGSQGDYARGEFAASLNYKADNFTLFGSVTGEAGDYLDDAFFNRNILYNDTLTRSEEVLRTLEREKTLELNAGFDWHLNSKTILGAKFTWDPGSDVTNTAGDNYFNYNNLGYTRLKFDNHLPDVWNYYNYNLNFERQIDTSGSKLFMAIDVNPNTERIDAHFRQHYLNGTVPAFPSDQSRRVLTDNTMLGTGRIDITKNFSDDLSFEIGARWSGLSQHRMYDVYQQLLKNGMNEHDTVISNTFSFTETTGAVYAQVSKSWEPLSVTAGCRIENTDISMLSSSQSFRSGQHYLRFFPSVSIVNEGERNNFTLSYNRRINRPDPYSFFPYPMSFTHLLLFEKGNPYLAPEYSNTFDFTHSYRKVITQSVSHSQIKDYIAFYTTQDDSAKITTTVLGNIGRSETIGYSLATEVQLKNRLTVNANAGCSHLKYSGTLNGLDFQAQGWQYHANATADYVFPGGWGAQCSMQYFGPTPAGFLTVFPKWALNFSLRKTFLEEKLTVLAGADDLFYRMISGGEADFDNQRWDVRNFEDTRRFKISISYTFGKSNVEIRETSSNEEVRSKLKH